MGKWFPGFRTGTKEQARAYREAQKALERSGREERAQGVRDETGRFHDLNRTAGERARPLSGPQRVWNFHRSLAELDREDTARQRASKQPEAKTTRRRSR